jgi:transposase
MNHVAIDLGGRESQICIRTPNGEIAEEKKVPTRRLPALLQSWTASRVILETSAEAFRIADAALESGHEVRVVPATMVKALGVGARGIKNDQRDARVLSEVSCRIDLPSVHVPSVASREMKSACGSREVLVESRTKLVNNVRGWLRTQLWRVRSGVTTTFPARVRGQATLQQEALPDHVERMLLVLDALNIQIKAADKQLQKVAGEHPVCRRLMTVPGVGPVTAVRFVAAIDDVKRFPTSHAVQSYLGLTPGENSSSERQQRTGITKAGSTALRRALIQGAWTAIRMCPREPMVQWATQIVLRRGKFIAVVALARKMAGILFALWRDGSTYRASMGARVQEALAPY